MNDRLISPIVDVFGCFFTDFLLHAIKRYQLALFCLSAVRRSSQSCRSSLKS